MHLTMLFTAILTVGVMRRAGRESQPQPGQPVLGARSIRLLDVDGLTFEDLNKNGRLDRYEDWRLPLDTRVNDLVGQMTLEEKAGLMVGPTLPMGANGTVNEDTRALPGNPFGGSSGQAGTTDLILARHIRQFINRVNTTPRTMVTWLNAVQELAERSRLGIPAFFVTNPRNHLGSAGVMGIDEAGSSFSQWPGTLGLAATRDAALVEEFSRIAAQEYVSVGIRGAYHPQADLATEPRWGRISGTLGEDATVASDLLRAMVRGFQGRALGPASVALIVKHFPGGGPARAGRTRISSDGKFDVSTRADNSTTTCVRSRRPSRPARRPSCRTARFRRTSRRTRWATAFNREIVTDLLRGTAGVHGRGQLGLGHHHVDASGAWRT
ncbi:MAG: hypothetical protein M0C28_26175 [Candidatus Moduliflexus flocculans]|nr:hypothetical protein [Candidatus Moduliflexus flocculans]